MLKIKSKIYRYTGIFLAYKEQSRYSDSKEFWNTFNKHFIDPENDMSPRDIHGLMIGMWQAKHGFTRPFVSWGWGKPWYVKFLAYLVTNFKSIYLDITR